jgi:hypothetical protein
MLRPSSLLLAQRGGEACFENIWRASEEGKEWEEEKLLKVNIIRRGI